MGHVARAEGSCRACERVMSHRHASRVTREVGQADPCAAIACAAIACAAIACAAMPCAAVHLLTESRRTCKQVMSHLQTSHVTR